MLEHWSGAGMLLYLVKQLRPEIANVTRELLKANNHANHAAFKELLCMIKAVLDTMDLGLKIEHTWNTNKPWKIVCFSNSNYVGDPENRRSISGSILYVLGVPASLQSMSQKSVYPFPAQR